MHILPVHEDDDGDIDDDDGNVEAAQGPAQDCTMKQVSFIPPPLGVLSAPAIAFMHLNE